MTFLTKGLWLPLWQTKDVTLLGKGLTTLMKKIKKTLMKKKPYMSLITCHQEKVAFLISSNWFQLSFCNP